MSAPEDWRERARHAVPPLEGELRVAGLSAPVMVLRDELGVPHEKISEFKRLTVQAAARVADGRAGGR